MRQKAALRAVAARFPARPWQNPNPQTLRSLQLLFVCICCALQALQVAVLASHLQAQRQP